MSRRIRILFLLLWLGGLLLNFMAPVKAQDEGEQPLVVVLTVDAAITPVMVNYLDRGFSLAREIGADVVVIRLNTPGGAIDAMDKIIMLIRSSDIPVVVYVSPRGAMAASAGTLITLAGDVAVMAPETTIGAASPVGSQGEDIGSTLESKVKEVLKATVRALTANRPPEAQKLAEDTIESAKAVTVDEALAIGLIDMKASSLEEMLNRLDGWQVITGEDTVITLRTRNAVIDEVNITFMENLLLWLTNPNIIFILLAIGVQAILIELSSPGGWVAGLVGVVCLLLAFYGVGVLPVNWFGFLFLIVAFVLFVLETQTPTQGALTVVGVISFIAGALILFDTVRVPGVPQISIPLVIATGIVLGAFFFAILLYVIKAQRVPILMGKEALIGGIGTVRGGLSPHGQVQVAGELWTAELAESDRFAGDGEQVEVVAVEGLRLKVKKVEKK